MALACATALLALACAAPPPEPPVQPALVALEVMRGLDTAPAPGDPGRVVALIDSTRSMSQRDPSGVVYLDAARRSAQRWLRDLPSATPVELRAVGGERGMHCASPARALGGPLGASDAALLGSLDRLAPLGEGSLAEALYDVAEALPGGGATPLRVVAWSALDDGCEASLCSAASALARRGVRLDLVVLGPAPAPSCLGQLELPRVAVEPARTAGPVEFCVERAGPEAAVWGCSKAGGLPVAAPPSAARVVVRLDPPLVVERSFPAETRWVLEVLDFPALGPGERQWRWRPLERGAGGAAVNGPGVSP
ncbi:MAG TPA: hypothetical protein VFY49_10555 [Myxococcota bacterium]|nr:hypothetical protein [Myxococcota bacterium]